MFARKSSTRGQMKLPAIAQRGEGATVFKVKQFLAPKAPCFSTWHS